MTANLPPDAGHEAGARGTQPPAPAGRAPSATWVLIAFLFVAAVLVYLLGYGR